MLADLELIYAHFLLHREIVTDSRKIVPGSLFFALKGETFNGNQYAKAALENGAAFAVVDDPAFSGQEKYLLVSNVLATLQNLARLHRKRNPVPVIAITGTNGKTTTKELIAAVLSRRFTALSTTGNLNNHIGVPLTILMINSATQIAVVEMGANHPGEIDFLCNIADPDFGLITNIGKAHLEGFGSYEGVKQTKTELYRYLKQKSGTVFINADDAVLQAFSAGINLVKYGKPPSELEPVSITAEPFVTVSAKTRDDKFLTLASRLHGEYNTPNILAAACIGNYFKVSPEDICDAISAYEPVNNRSQVNRTERNILVMDAYNANPSSMEAALKAFSAAGYHNKVVILGDMLELGRYTDEEHVNIILELQRLGFHEVYLVGPVFSRVNSVRDFICFQDSELARLWFEHHKPENNTILLKGSRGIRLEKVASVL